MSEYQYYEFQAVDRAVALVSDLRRWLKRMTPWTHSQAVWIHYGSGTDARADSSNSWTGLRSPEEVLLPQIRSAGN